MIGPSDALEIEPRYEAENLFRNWSVEYSRVHVAVGFLRGLGDDLMNRIGTFNTDQLLIQTVIEIG